LFIVLIGAFVGLALAGHAKAKSGRGERPRRRRGAEEGDELAPSHLKICVTARTI
jgi:hypothetical protein